MLEVFAVFSLFGILALGCYAAKDKLLKLFIFCMCPPNVTKDWKSKAEDKTPLQILRENTASRRQPLKDATSSKIAFVSFGPTQMYISAGLIRSLKNDWRSFDMMVNNSNRTFGLKFHENGKLRLNSEPGQVSVNEFITNYGPSKNTKLFLKPLKSINPEEEIWVGELD